VAVISVICGFAIWSAIWLGANALLRLKGVLPGEGQPVSAPKALVALICISCFACAVSGFAAASLGGRPAARTLAILLFLTGAVVQYQLRALMPTWYHVSFLTLLVPLTLIGGLASRQDSSQQDPTATAKASSSPMEEDHGVELRPLPSRTQREQ
jgi:hypothetical protein